MSARPSVGALLRADGTSVQLRFVETSEPDVFLAVTVDGDRVDIEAGDNVHVDVLGPGQSVVVGGVDG